MNSDEWMKLDSTTLKNIAKKFGIKETTKSKIVLSLLNKIEEETRINVNDLEEKIEELKNQLEEARRNNSNNNHRFDAQEDQGNGYNLSRGEIDVYKDMVKDLRKMLEDERNVLMEERAIFGKEREDERNVLREERAFFGKERELFLNEKTQLLSEISQLKNKIIHLETALRSNYSLPLNNTVTKFTSQIENDLHDTIENRTSPAPLPTEVEEQTVPHRGPDVNILCATPRNPRRNRSLRTNCLRRQVMDQRTSTPRTPRAPSRKSDGDISNRDSVRKRLRLEPEAENTGTNRVLLSPQGIHANATAPSLSVPNSSSILVTSPRNPTRHRQNVNATSPSVPTTSPWNHRRQNTSQIGSLIG